jgi:recombination protein RecR
MDAIERLAAAFAEFPGVGPRQARRMVFWLLRKPRGFAEELARLLPAIAAGVRPCPSCFRYSEAPQGQLCRICASPDRDPSTLLVVCRDQDLEGVERAGAYRGRYFVLGGSAPILEKSPERLIRLSELCARAEKDAALKEIVVATNATADGDYTAKVVREWLEPIAASRGLRVTLLGRGLSTGAELEYADPDTVRAAISGRH